MRNSLYALSAVCLMFVLSDIFPTDASGIEASSKGDTETLEAGDLVIELDSSWPRIIGYRHRSCQTLVEGQLAETHQVLLNGELAECVVTFKKTGADSGVYGLRFSDAAIDVQLAVKVSAHDVMLSMKEPRESGTARLRTLSFPDNALITLRATEPDTTIATAYATSFEPPRLQVVREQLGLLSKQSPGELTGNYFFGATGALATGLADNHYSDADRVHYQITKEKGANVCRVRNVEWAFRAVDDDVLPLPYVRVFVTPDCNGDGEASWQDAALVYRETMPLPFGWEQVRETVSDQIAMNFASGAQQPFLRILDHVKKIYLATDGLGQQILIKGFSAEGHDSANTDYGGHANRRAGGLDDLTFLQKQAKAYNARIGIHINASEVYPEAHRYRPDILRRDKQGRTVNGWRWLDQAKMIDKVKDTTSGELFTALDQMRNEQPELDFVYVDTYWTHGWTAWKIAEKMRSLGLPLYTEGNASLDPWTTWAHGRGKPVKTMRFLWYSHRDLYGNDILLREGQHVGFLSWHGEFDFNTFIRGVFGQNLPAKYLKHFDLLVWEPGKQARFSDGVMVSKEGKTVTCTRNGRVVMTWNDKGKGNRLFVPWDPREESKIFVWDEVAEEGEWELPRSWKGRSEVFQYRLTALGRTEETRIPVQDGKVQLSVTKATPYVLYPERAPQPSQMVWGEGSPVRDPGFNNHRFDSWVRELGGAGEDHIRIENDKRENARLLIGGKDRAGGAVSQQLAGLEPGGTYTATVWAQSEGRSVSLEVQPTDADLVSRSVAFTRVRHRAPCDRRNGTYYQLLRIRFTLPEKGTTAQLTLRVGEGDAAAVAEFDDVRVVRSQPAPAEAKGHWFYEDFEGFDQNWGPFTWIVGEHTHLSETHVPYTHDTIKGHYSFKTMNERNALVARTVPASLPFESWTRYRLTCETIADESAKYRLQVKEGDQVVFDQAVPAGRANVYGEFVTRGSGEAYLSLVKESGGMCVLDDLVIDRLGPVDEKQREAVGTDQE